ncbi:MAG: hypothetical protein R2701_01540 [Acidimicrobiales bacterium]|nr:hypothetical protein [Acidimicrobiales bacterium]
MTDRVRCQRGQAALLALVAVLFAGLLAAGVVRVGAAVAQRGSVQAAADAVALASAGGGPAAAQAVADANHVEVVSITEQGNDVVVIVGRDHLRATARARWAPRPIP